MSSPRVLKIILFALLTALAAWVAYFQMFTYFAYYDDEGYVMITLKYFIKGYPLYDDVYTQYGPAFYLIKGLFHPLVSISHNEGRLFSIGVWLGTVLLISLFTYRVTRSVALSTLAHLLSFIMLGVVTKEPGHPQEICGFILALAAVFSTTRRGLPVVGFLAGVLILIKINVGLFLLLAIGLLFPGKIRFVPLMVSLPLPALIMRHHLITAWGLQYCLVATISIVGAFIVMLRHADGPRFTTRQAWITSGAFAVTFAAICGATLLLGTSLPGLIDGVVLEPLNLAVKAPLSLPFTSAAIPCGCLALILAAVTGRQQRISAGLKIAFGLAVCCFILAGSGDTGGGDTLLLYAAPFLWLGMLTDHFPRAFVCAVALLQILQAYPVAGSQLAFGTFLMIPTALCCLRDGLLELLPAPDGRKLSYAALLIVVALTTSLYVRKGILLYQTYLSYASVNLPGADKLKLPPTQAATYNCIAQQLARTCETFVTAPGINSFYFWAQKEPPTHLNATLWERLLTAEQQQKIVNSFSQHPMGCALVLDYHRLQGDVKASPLMRYIKENFHEIDQVGDYIIMIRNDRPPPPFLSCS